MKFNNALLHSLYLLLLGQKSNDPANPDFAPTIFSFNSQRNSVQKVDRFKRLQNRRESAAAAAGSSSQKSSADSIVDNQHQNVGVIAEDSLMDQEILSVPTASEKGNLFIVILILRKCLTL